jgi:dihydrofolate synthase/folylpolyglutamate synthase
MRYARPDCPLRFFCKFAANVSSMNYREALDFLYTSLPMFQKIGKAAFKKDLSNTLAFCRRLGNPEAQFPSLHIAGTNGKGSSAHSIAAVLQAAGYRTALYTSPHLRDFRERIRIDGHPISEQAVCEFVVEHKSFIRELQPSFFETTVAMAFDHFAGEQVDIAIIEVGMGGRLDSTNVIQPLVSLITHIGYDHMEFLGDTLELIAAEKAGIIKEDTPVVIGERQAECFSVFERIAREKQAPLAIAADIYRIEADQEEEGERLVNVYENEKPRFTGLRLSLMGDYQLKNLPGILLSLERLREKGYHISDEHIRRGLAEVAKRTGLQGRWQVLGRAPLRICDTGHNEGAVRDIVRQLHRLCGGRLYMVIGMSAEKEVDKLLALMPKEAYYLFCRAKLPRAMDVHLLAAKASQFGLRGEVSISVNAAYRRALEMATKQDCVFVGGSTFVVAELEELEQG